MKHLPKTWQIKKLGEVLILNQLGIWGDEPDENKKYYPVIRSTEMTHDGQLDLTSVALRHIDEDKLDRFSLNDGDILIVKSSGSSNLIGRCALFKHPSDKITYLFSNFIQRLRPNNLISPKFLYYFLNFEGRKFVEYLQTTTTGLRNLPIKQYLKLQIPLPTLSDQHHIVKKIEELFEKIDRAKKLREEAIEETENFIPSALREIFKCAKKEKWEERRIEELCEINPSKTEIRDFPDTLEVSFVPMSSVDDKTGMITFAETRKLKEVRKGYTYFKENDVLFAKITPCMENGKSAIARSLKNGIGFGSTEFHVLRPSKEFLPTLLHFIIRQKSFREEAERHFTGTAGQQRVPEEFLRNATISVPPLPQQHRIVKYLDSLQSQVAQLKQLQSETQKELGELKKSILDKAFKGEL